MNLGRDSILVKYLSDKVLEIRRAEEQRLLDDERRKREARELKEKGSNGVEGNGRR